VLIALAPDEASSFASFPDDGGLSKKNPTFRVGGPDDDLIGSQRQRKKGGNARASVRVRRSWRRR